MPTLPRVSLPIPPEFALIVAEVVVMWGNLDDNLDSLREALTAQPECQGVAPFTGSPFIRRLYHFETLCEAYFARSRPLLVFARTACNDIRVLKGERHLVVHGRYGLENSGSPLTTSLRLWDRPGGPNRARLYSLLKFRELANHIGMALAQLRWLACPPPGPAEKEFYLLYGFSKHKYDYAQSILHPIREYCRRTTREMYERAP